MSITTEPFGPEGQFATYDPYGGQRRVIMYILQCRACGYQPEQVTPVPNACPKCSGSAFERLAIPGSLLAWADHR